MHIARKKVDRKQLDYRYHDALKNYGDSLAELAVKPRYVRSLANEALELFCTSFLFEESREHRATYLRHYAEAALATFQVGLAVGTPVTYRLGGTSFTITAEVAEDVTVLRWTRMCYAALILDDAELLAQVIALDLARIAEVATARSEAYDLRFAACLKQWCQHRGDEVAELEAAAAATAEVRPTSPLHGYMVAIGRPQIDVLSSLVRGDRDAFAPQLAQALESHKAYFEGETKKGLVDFIGLVSLPLSALAIRARDAGFSVDVTSDYLYRAD